VATELGKAYVQIMPSAKGISKEITKTLDPEMKTAGKNAGSSIVSSIKKVIVAAGIGKAISMAISEGGALQQSIGGIETLFKDHADRVKKYASEAYKTVGVSANEYMEQVTSFSASLLQSLGGDTGKAADKANMAMIDMADNANKMGTNMRDIQNAYQGFAKQNYTMLDNLKLGYGGTKSEMERLLADAQKLTGVKYDINNLADVYEAIHVIQTELGITGTTAKEASETLTGSFGALKAAFTDTLGAMALGQDIGPMLQNLSTTLITFLQNLMPMVTNTIMQIPQIIVSVVAEAGPSFIQTGMQAISDLLTGLGQALPELIPAAVEAVLTLVSTFIENIPMLVQSGLDLIIGLAEGLINAIPIIIEKVPEIINSILATIIDLLPLIIDAGVELFTSLVEELPTIINNIVAVLPDIIEGIINTIGTLVPLIIDAGIKLLVALVENLPAIINGIVEAIPKIIDSIINALVNNIPLIISAGVKLLTALITNLPTIIATIVRAMPKIISNMVSALGKGISAFAEVGTDLVKGLWNGIKSVKNWILGKIKGFVGDITSGIKSFFGIKSPSKVMANEVGKWLPEGLAEGIEDNTKPVSKAMEKLGKLTTGTLESQIRVSSIGPANVKGLGNSKGITQHITINSPKPLSPSETARQVKNASRQLAMEW
jgi:phage-related protein